MWEGGGKRGIPLDFTLRKEYNSLSGNRDFPLSSTMKGNKMNSFEEAEAKIKALEQEESALQKQQVETKIVADKPFKESQKARKREENRRYREKKQAHMDKLIAAYGGIPIFDPITDQFLGVRQKYERISSIVERKAERPVEEMSRKDLLQFQITNLQKQIDEKQEEIDRIELEEQDAEGGISDEEWEAYKKEHGIA